MPLVEFHAVPYSVYDIEYYSYLTVWDRVYDQVLRTSWIQLGLPSRGVQGSPCRHDLCHLRCSQTKADPVVHFGSSSLASSLHVASIRSPSSSYDTYADSQSAALALRASSVLHHSGGLSARKSTIESNEEHTSGDDGGGN